MLQQRLCFGIRRCRGADDDVHAPDVVDLVVLDLGEDDMLFDAHGEVATAIERLAGDAAEVADARHCDRDHAVEEVVHPVAAQRYLAADRHAVAQLEAGDGLAGLGDHRLLAGNGHQLVVGVLDLLGIADRLADPHVQHDLVEPRDHHLVLVVELFLQRGTDRLAVDRLQTRNVGGAIHRFATKPVKKILRIFLKYSYILNLYVLKVFSLNASENKHMV